MRTPHILIADDETPIRLTISLVLKRKNYKVSTAADGVAALKVFQEAQEEGTPVDLLITDIFMPGMDGLELIDHIRRQRHDMPIIGITAFGDKEVVVELLRRKVNDYIEKPVDEEAILGCIQQVMDRHRAHGELEEERISHRAREMAKRETESFQRRLQDMRSRIDKMVGSYQRLTRHVDEKETLVHELRQQSMEELGGDFVEVRAVEGGYRIVVADVAGHDVGSTYHTILVKAAFESHLRTGSDPLKFLRDLNQQLVEGGDSRMVTACYVDLSLERRTATVYNAGHVPPLLLSSRDEQIHELHSKGGVLGVFDILMIEPYTQRLNKEDRLYIYSDGLPGLKRLDPASGLYSRLGQVGLSSLLRRHRKMPLRESCDAVWSDLQDYCYRRPNDDMLLFAIEMP